MNRPNGRELQYSPPGSGNVYVSDSDVSDSLVKQADGTWHLTTSTTDDVEIFDAPGFLQRIRNRAGRELVMTYSTGSTPPSVAPASGLLITVTDSWSRQLNFFYDAARRIVRATDPGGGEYLFEYDGPSGPAGAYHNLTKITFPDTRTRVYFYAEPAHINGGTACASPPATLNNLLTGIQDENGTRYATWTYDCQGRSSGSQRAAGAGSYAFSYDANSTVVVDPLNTSRTIGIQGVLGVARSTGTTQPAASGSGSASTTVSRDANGNVSSRIDFNGNRTNYSYL